MTMTPYRAKIKSMVESGMSDREIADVLKKTTSCIGTMRNLLGLPPNKKGRKDSQTHKLSYTLEKLPYREGEIIGRYYNKELEHEVKIIAPGYGVAPPKNLNSF